jgi:molybdate transport system regulatory protein
VRVGALDLKLRVLHGDGYALGPGKADLLAAIAAHGSISAAARALGMSYRRAWTLVDEMNRRVADRVVEAAPGGGAKGGARLTAAGRTALAAYRALEAEAARLVDQPAYAALAGALRDEGT